MTAPNSVPARRRFARAFRQDNGYVTVLAASVTAILTVVCASLAAVCALVVDDHRATVAADMAAIAGAHAAWYGFDACRSAEDTVQRHGATLDRCEVNGADVTVTVTIRRREASSRAGPL